MRNPTVIAALISGLIAALVSAITAFFTTQFEMEKIVVSAQQSAQQNALQQVIEARLKVYSKPYSLISQLEKDADAHRIDIPYLENLKTAFDHWDSKHAYLLGPDTTNIANAFRHALLKCIEVKCIQESENQEQFDMNIADLKPYVEQLELALRSDLGIYGLLVANPDSPIDPVVPGSYEREPKQ